jgi:hypothetical protein
VPHLAAVGHCGTCIHPGAEYDVASSSTAHVLDGSTFNLSLSLPEPELSLSGMIVNDTLSYNGTALLPEGLCSVHKIMSIVNGSGPAGLPDGVSGYFGLGIEVS